MIEVAAPTVLAGPLLHDELAAAGLETEVLLVGSNLVLPDVAETQRTEAEAVVEAHPSTAKAWFDAAEVQRANEATIRQRAEQARATNATFLALTSPTNAQNAAQIKALTRQVNGLIRLLLSQFDGTD